MSTVMGTRNYLAYFGNLKQFISTFTHSYKQSPLVEYFELNYWKKIMENGLTHREKTKFLKGTEVRNATEEQSGRSSKEVKGQLGEHSRWLLAERQTHTAAEG